MCVRVSVSSILVNDGAAFQVDVVVIHNVIHDVAPTIGVVIVVIVVVILGVLIVLNIVIARTSGQHRHMCR